MLTVAAGDDGAVLVGWNFFVSGDRGADGLEGTFHDLGGDGQFFLEVIEKEKVNDARKEDEDGEDAEEFEKHA